MRACHTQQKYTLSRTEGESEGAVVGVAVGVVVGVCYNCVRCEISVDIACR